MPRRARNVEPVRFLDGYIRVSRVGKRRGPGFISPTVQREAIERWATQPGVQLGEIFEELDESGARRDRPLLERAIARIESGGSDGLVVWRVDRFGRSLIDGLAHVERVRKAGGTFYATYEGLDSSTDAGRLALRILLSVAEFQLEGIREGWEQTRRRTVARGVYARPHIPPGYRKTRAGHLRPDPVTFVVMAEAFRRRSGGESARRVGDFLEENEVRTAAGNLCWSPTTVDHLMRSRVYLGEIRAGRYVREGAHPPLVDRATFEAAAAPRQLVKATINPPALLSGLVRCANCRMSLSCAVHQGQRVYCCRGISASGHCPKTASVSAHLLEPYVVEAMFRLLRQRRRRPSVARAAAQAKLDAAEAALRRYRDSDTVFRALGEEAYLAGVAARTSRVRAAALDLADVKARFSFHDLPPTARLRDQWDELSLAERRRTLSQVIDCVFVAPGRRMPERRITICPAGTAPRDLPRQGAHKTKPLRAIQPRARWLNPPQPHLT